MMEICCYTVYRLILTITQFNCFQYGRISKPKVENISDEMRQQIRPLMRDTYNFVQGNVIQLKNI